MDSVFGDIGGSGKQTHGAPLPPIQDGPRNADGEPNANPSGGGGPVPAHGGLFGDLGGPGQQHAATTAPEPGSGDFPEY